jgi:hypothetical protein
VWQPNLVKEMVTMMEMTDDWTFRLQAERLAKEMDGEEEPCMCMCLDEAQAKSINHGFTVTVSKLMEHVQAVDTAAVKAEGAEWIAAEWRGEQWPDMEALRDDTIGSWMKLVEARRGSSSIVISSGGKGKGKGQAAPLGALDIESSLLPPMRSVINDVLGGQSACSSNTTHYLVRQSAQLINDPAASTCWAPASCSKESRWRKTVQLCLEQQRPATDGESCVPSVERMCAPLPKEPQELLAWEPGVAPPLPQYVATVLDARKRSMMPLTVCLQQEEANDDSIGEVGQSDFSDQYRVLERKHQAADDPEAAPLPVIPKAPDVTELLRLSQEVATQPTASIEATAATQKIPAAAPELSTGQDDPERRSSVARGVRATVALPDPSHPVSSSAAPPEHTRVSLQSMLPPGDQLNTFKSMRSGGSTLNRDKAPASWQHPPTSPSPPPPESSPVEDFRRRWQVTPLDLLPQSESEPQEPRSAAVPPPSHASGVRIRAAAAATDEPVLEEDMPGPLTPPAAAMAVILMEEEGGERKRLWGHADRRVLQESVLKLERMPNVRVVGRRVAARTVPPALVACMAHLVMPVLLLAGAHRPCPRV